MSISPDKAGKQHPVIPGVDFEARTVQPAADVAAALDEFETLKAFFCSLSFSHKKEYVQYVEAAKKPETRLRRIDKMMEMLLALQAQKKK